MPTGNTLDIHNLHAIKNKIMGKICMQSKI